VAPACAVIDCDRSRVGRGWCLKHYKRWQRTGSPTGLNAETRFFARVTEGPAGCWTWDRVMDNGYGQFTDNKRIYLAHRWSYEFLRAEIPAGLELDHLCRVKACVNPWHLEPVTRSVNVQRTYLTCPNGHEYTEENTEHYSYGPRRCKKCRIEHDRRARQRQLAKLRS